MHHAFSLDQQCQCNNISYLFLILMFIFVIMPLLVAVITSVIFSCYYTFPCNCHQMCHIWRLAFSFNYHQMPHSNCVFVILNQFTIPINPLNLINTFPRFMTENMKPLSSQRGYDSKHCQRHNGHKS